jgi:hypothetical protein
MSTPAATAPNAAAKPNPIKSLSGEKEVAGVKRDFAAVVWALGWDVEETDHLAAGDILPVGKGADGRPLARNGKNGVYLAGDLFAACEAAWGKRPGENMHATEWKAFMDAHARLTAQARRAHLLMGSDGVVRESPEEAAARVEAEGTSRSRGEKTAKSLLKDGTLFGEPWAAKRAEALVAAVGGRLPGRDALARALESCGFVLRTDEGGITWIEAPKPPPARALSDEQKAKLVKADKLDRQAERLAEEVPVAAAALHEEAKRLRAEVDAEAGPASELPPGPVDLADAAAREAEQVASDADRAEPPAPPRPRVSPADFGRYLSSLPDPKDAALAVRDALSAMSVAVPGFNKKALKSAGPDDVRRMTAAAYAGLAEEARGGLLSAAFGWARDEGGVHTEGDVVSDWLAANPAAA